MKPELEALVKAERKFARELLELRQLRQKVSSHKNPDTKTLKMIDDEIDQYTKGK